jgi:DNA polymerase I-like protein with 3'-5' exonuclease and polymerase domains
MKKAMIKTHRWIASGEVPGIKLVAWVHDEFQMEVKKGYEELVIQKVVGFIEEVGRELNLACKLTGSGGYGASWAESH